MTNKKFSTPSRKEKAREIFEKGHVSKTTLGWTVVSQSRGRAKYYSIKLFKGQFSCDCKDYQNNFSACKHIYAVELFQSKDLIMDKEEITIKKTYSQEWSSYNEAQCIEKIQFMKLLREMCNLVEQPQYDYGRPNLPWSDLLYGAIMKVYTGFSLRRFTSDMQIAYNMGIVEVVPSFSTLSNFMNNEEVRPILAKLILTSSAPLREVETEFAADASGFSTSRFAKWFDYKWGKEKKYKYWVKLHINSGVKTNIITAVEVTGGFSSDSTELKSLLEQTAKNFNMVEVSGDKAYSSKTNLELIHSHGAIPYIPFKSNTSGRARGSAIWAKMYALFMYKNDEFMKHYNKRSNVETCFHMIKSKFGDSIRSKKETSQVNEVLIKALCHNLVVLIHEMCTLNIKVDFKTGLVE